jgi:PAS domain S-box-containing protein
VGTGVREMFDKLADKIITATPLRIFVSSIILSIFLSELISILCSLYFFGRIKYIFVVTGAIASLIVSAVVVGIILLLLREFEEIRQSFISDDEKLNSLLGNINDGFVLADLEGRVLYANKKFGEMVGYSTDDLITTKIADLFPKDRQEITARIFERLRKGETVRIGENTVLKRTDGKTVPVQVIATPVDFFGRKAVQGIFRDISQHKDTEKKLEVLEKNFADILSKSTDTFYRTNLAGEIAWITPDIRRLTGYIADEVIGKKMADFYADPSVMGELIKQLNENDGVVEDFQVRIKKKDGASIWVSTNASYFYDDSGEVIGIEGVARDITGKRSVEEALRRSEEQYRVLIENIQEGVFLIQDEKVLFVNDQMANMIGYTVEEIRGKNFTSFIAPEDVPMVAERYRMRHAGAETPSEYDYHMLHKDGKTRIVVNMVVSITTFKGRQATAGTITNITDKRKLEIELTRRQKLESVGLLAGGIAHDFNNLLTSILGGLSLVKIGRAQEGDVEGEQILEESINATRRAKELTRQLLTFAKGGKPVKQVIDFKTLLTESVRFALRGSDSTYKLSITDDLRNAEADEGQMNQVINNLVINADQSMPEGGVIDVVAYNITLKSDSGIPLPAGEYVCFGISDSGVGIPEEFLEKIFDPYFTSKQKGSGLGLATTYSIVRNHDGLVTVDSELGKGSAFKVFLPASGKPVAKSDYVEKIVKGYGRVLIMDDEDVVRNVFGRMLKKLGYDVAFAINGDEAISMFKAAMKNGNAFDAIITDLTIPGGMGGMKVVEILGEVEPGIKAIATSGYSSDPIMGNFWEYGFSGVIQKPFELEDLSQVIGSVLGKQE